jgi:hypothetical protein
MPARLSVRLRAAFMHEVLALAHNGTLVDLSGMRSDQRAPVVATLAIKELGYAFVSAETALA